MIDKKSTSSQAAVGSIPNGSYDVIEQSEKIRRHGHLTNSVQFCVYFVLKVRVGILYNSTHNRGT